MTSKVLLAGGCVLTLGARTPNHQQADVLIDGEVIAEVGTRLRARDAEQIDATDTIVMPGFVDTHRHAWTSLLRNAGERGAHTEPADGGPHGYTPDDVYASTLIGLLGAASARSSGPAEDQSTTVVMPASAAPSSPISVEA